MNVIPITDDLADSYHGAGYALAAVTGGRIMKLVYTEDVAPQLELSHESVTEWILSWSSFFGHPAKVFQAVACS